MAYHTINVDGYRVAYDTAGTGHEIVIFMHGVGSDRTTWRDQLRAVADAGYTAAAFDYRGHGKSDVPPPGRIAADISRAGFARDALAVLDALGGAAAKGHFVGLSLGGVVALEIYQTAPERVASLVLADSFARYPDADAGIAKRTADIDRMGVAEFARQRAAALFAPDAPNTDPARIADAIAVMARKDHAAFRQSHVVTWSPDYEALLPQIGVPTLVLVGAADVVTPSSLSQHLADAIPGAQMVTLVRAGHLANVDNPKDFTDAVLGFLQTTLAQQ